MTMSAKTGQSANGWHKVAKFITCPQAYAYGYRLGLRVPVEKPEPAKGTVLHEMLLVWHTGGSKADALATAYAMPSRYKLAIAPAVLLFEAYVQRYPAEAFTVLAAEHEVAVLLGGIPFTRRIDLIVQSPPPQSLVLILDHKTAGRPGLRAKGAGLDWSLMTQELVMRPQCHAMFGVNYGGFVLNLVGTQEPEFKRVPVAFSPVMMEAAPRSIYRYLKQMQELDATTDPWEYPRTGACVQRYGVCDFAAICEYGKRAADAFDCTLGDE